MARASMQPQYDVHPGVAMVQKWVAELKGITHCIEIVPSDQIDAEVTKWLKTAYLLDQ